MEILSRIKALIDDKGCSTKSFSEEIGIAQTTLSTYFTKNSYPAYETLHAILHRFTDVSAEWLMRGEGNMYICDDLPALRGDESEEEKDLHAALAKCRAKLEDSQNENVKLMGQLEFMEEYNMKVVGKLKEAQKKLEELEKK